MSLLYIKAGAKIKLDYTLISAKDISDLRCLNNVKSCNGIIVYLCNNNTLNLITGFYWTKNRF